MNLIFQRAPSIIPLPISSVISIHGVTCVGSSSSFLIMWKLISRLIISLCLLMITTGLNTMDSKKVFQSLANYSIGFIVLMLITGCTIGRVYVGSDSKAILRKSSFQVRRRKARCSNFLAPQISSNGNMTETYLFPYLIRRITQARNPRTNRNASSNLHILQYPGEERQSCNSLRSEGMLRISGFNEEQGN